MKSQLNNALAFFQVVAIITNLSTFASAKIHNFFQFQHIRMKLYCMQVSSPAIIVLQTRMPSFFFISKMRFSLNRLLLWEK